MKREVRDQRSHFAFLFLLLVGSTACAADAPRSTDHQLRDSLNSKAGDDYDRQLLGDPAKGGDEGRVDDQIQKKLQKELGAAARQEGKEKAPLLQIAEAMRAVQKRIGQRDSGAQTQFAQKQIVSKLAELIEQAKKSGSCNGQSSNTRKPTGGGEKKPAAKSGQASGNSPAPAEKSNPEIRKAEDVRVEAAKQAHERMIKFHAELQGRPGEQKIVEPGEYFLPGYELEIEDYFRRLSEEHPDLGRP